MSRNFMHSSHIRSYQRDMEDQGRRYRQTIERLERDKAELLAALRTWEAIFGRDGATLSLLTKDALDATRKVIARAEGKS